MSDLTINGKRVSIASITFPFYGAWSADVVMLDNSPIASAVTMVVGDLTVVGTVVRQASFAGNTSARIVGGAGGWRNALDPKGYSHVAGVKLSTVIQDVARSCGETIAVSADRTLGTHWARDNGKGERTLNILLDGEWWIDSSGVTQTGTRDASAIVTPFTVVERSGSKGQFEIASEAISPWQPGRKFTSLTVPDEQTISSVTIESSNDGKRRLHVLTTDGAVERLRSSVRSLVQQELSAMLFFGTWEYVVAPSLGLGTTSTVDCTPTDPRMPPLTNVPIKGIGVVAAPLAGTICRIQFVNGNPSRPECTAIEGTTEPLMTIKATTLLIYNTLATLMSAAGGGALLAVTLQPLLATAITAALTAQGAPAPPTAVAQVIAAAAFQAGFATGLTPSPATFAAWDAVIDLALTGKTLDTSGLFPSVGIPNG
jgi:hypothetical protein